MSGVGPLFFVFDFGGVLTSNAFPGMAEYSFNVFDHTVKKALSTAAATDAQRNILEFVAPLLRPQVKSFFSAVNKYEAFTQGRSSFQELECGHISRGEYCRGFAARARACVSGLYAPRIAKKIGAAAPQLPAGVTEAEAVACGVKLMEQMTEAFDIESVMSILERSPLRRNVVELIDFIRTESDHVQSPSVIRVGLITNNWRGMGVTQGIATVIKHALVRRGVEESASPFHVIVESCKEGQRKPNSAIFKSARQRLLATIPGASEDTATTMIFFDDLTPNCDGALKSGVVTKAVLVKNPASVFSGIVDALKAHGHTTLAAGVQSRFEAKFATAAAGRTRDNYLYFPPPSTPNLLPESKIPVKQRFSEEEKTRLAAYLGGALPLHFPMDLQLVADGGPMVVEYFKGGMSNPTFRLTIRTGSYVLRKQPKGKLLKGAHDIKREFYIMRHLRATGTVPVPHALHLCEDVSVLGTPFYVMKFVEGEVLRAPGIAAQPRGREIVEQLVDALAALHRAGPPAELIKQGGSDSADGAAHPMLRVVKTWQRQYAAGNKNLAAVVEKAKAAGKTVAADEGPFTVPDLEQLGQRLARVLQSNAIPLQTPTLVHGDYNFGNMIIDGLNTGIPAIAAILDFELSHVGDPLSDVGYMCVFYRLPNPIGFVGLPGVEKLPTVEQIIARYCEASKALPGLSAQQRNQIFAVYMAVAAFKIACITHGIVSRSRIGNASDVAAGLQFTAVCEVTSSVGLTILNEAKIPKHAADAKL